MKSICLITSHAPSLVNFRATAISSLTELGYKVWALAPNFDDEIRAKVIQLGATPLDCPIERAGMNPLMDMLNTWRLFLLLRKLKPDVVLGYFIKPVVFGSLAAFLARVPRRIAMVEGLGFVFTECDEPLSRKRRLLKSLVLLLYKAGMACAHRVVFLNPDDRDELIAAGVVPVDKTYLLGGIGVDLQQWPPLAYPIGPITFLLVARLLREKGIKQYVDAARLVKVKHPQARFILLGGLDDNPGALTENQVLAWAQEGVVEWHGHTAVQPWMAHASVYVLPSWREGVPVSTQEAMASSRAVITTNVPGCRETVIDGVNGFLVPPRDPQALAEAMCRFIQWPDLVKTMGEASLALARERYNEHEVNARLMSVLLGEVVTNEKAV